jgi:hypothetical protein
MPAFEFLCVIMKLAGELDDRWLREGAGLKPGTTTGREESPDTALRQQRKFWGYEAKGNTFGYRLRARGNAPGNARGTAAQT